jgi:DNA-binding Lrp family transcriptional regulator
MMTMKRNAQRVLSLLARGLSENQTATGLAERLKMSRWGVWKILNELDSAGLIDLKSVGTGKTSAYLTKLNWKNDLLEKTLFLIFAHEAAEFERWKFAFSKLEKYADFVILYGSILHSPKTALDIDVLIVSDKKNFIKIDEIIREIKSTQFKKIHEINFTMKEFKHELQKPNKAFIDAVRTGAILFGQERFIKLIKDLSK